MNIYEKRIYSYIASYKFRVMGLEFILRDDYIRFYEIY